MPLEVHIFEALALSSAVVGLVHLFAVSDPSLWDAIVMTAPTVALIFLVSRKRKNWARLVLAILFVAGLVMMIVMRRIAFAEGYWFVTLAVTLLQGGAIALAFTKEASTWIKKGPSL